MIIKGMRKVTLLDYPGKVACSIFLSGCNMRCSFCHNKSIVENLDDSSISYEEVMSFLDERRGMLDAVCITGGEPTLNSDLIDFIKDIKTKGFLVKLDTNGTNPSIIKKLLDNNLIDYIAMDVKSSLEKYNSITNTNVDSNKIIESINFIKNSGIDHEFRTTVISSHDLDDIVEIAKLVSPSKLFLQEFKYNDDIIDKTVSGVDISILEKYKNEANNYTKTFIRKK